MEQKNITVSRTVFWLMLCFTASGMSGLIYEVAWVRSLELIFGTTSFAVATVLAAFMGGLACGSYCMGKYSHRFVHYHPLKVYAVIEVLIGIVGLLLPLAFHWLVPAYKFIWSHFQASFVAFSLVRLLLCVLVLLVPTFLMGATLPIVSSFVGSASRQGHRGIGLLYAVNTAGAVLGCLAAGLILFRFVGVQKTQWIAVALNLMAAFGAFILAAKHKEKSLDASVSDGVAEQQEFAQLASPLSRRDAGLLVAIYAISGFIAMLYEVAWTRVLVLVLGSSIYAYTIMLGTFLTGLALGSCLAVRLAARGSNPLLNAGLAQLLIGLATYASLFFVEELPYLYMRACETFDPSANGLLTIQFVLAAALMILPTLGLGAMFPITLRGLNPSGAKTARVVGWAYAWNTFGAIGGSVIAGFWLIPLIGSQQTLIVGVALNALLAAAAFYSVASGRLARYRLATVVLIVAFAANSLANTPRWSPSILSTGIFRYVKDYAGLDRNGFRERARKIQGEVLFFKEGLTCTITVFRNPQNLILAVNGKPDASTPSGLVNPFSPAEPLLGDLPTQSLVGHLPLLLGPKPDNVLVVGLGSGVTVGALLQHPVREIECIELEKAVVDAEKLFQDYNNKPLADPRVKMIVNDARNHLLVTDKKYDVIVSEPSNPWLPGPAKLFTTEFFELAKSKLQPDGVMCQWIQLYEIHHSHFQTILRTYMGVFPNVHLFRVNHDAVLVGSLSPRPISWEDIERQMTPRLKQDLDRLRIHSTAELLAHYWIGGDELRSAVERGLFNTDDNLFIEFEAPLKVIRRKNEAQEYAEMLGLFLDRSTALVPNLALPAGTNDAEFWAEMAAACLRQPHPPKAKLYAAHSMKLKPNAAAARVYGEALAELGERDGAVAFLERAETELGPVAEVERALASIFIREGNWVRARAAAEKVLAREPSDNRARLWLGQSLFHLNETNASLAALEALQSAPLSDADETQLAFCLGSLYVNTGQFDKAIPLLRRFLQGEPMHREARSRIAEALYRTGERSEAAAQWQLLGRVSSVQAATRLREAQRALARHDLRTARTLLEEAWQLDRWNDDINLELVRVLEASGDPASAIASLKQYLSWKKDSPWAIGYLSQLLAAQHDVAQAAQLAARYRALTGSE
jgi:spermidine synthase